MQHARGTLKKIYGDAVRREGGDGPLTAWPLACGSHIAERTHAVSYAEGVLIVAVPDEAWRAQLQSFVPQYVAALNQIVSEPVTRIELRVVRH